MGFPRCLARRNSFGEKNDTLVLSNFQQLVGVNRREDWDLLGVPHGVSVCSLNTDDPKFFIHSAMVNEAIVRPLFTPFQ